MLIARSGSPRRNSSMTERANRATSLVIARVAATDARELQQVVDQPAHLLGIVADDVEHAAALAVQEVGVISRAGCGRSR